MINFFIHENNRNPLKRLRQAPDIGRFIRVHKYQEVFRRLRVPVGPLVFTDLDLLNPRQVEAAANMAETVLAIAPETPVLNHPARLMERAEMLDRRHAADPRRIAVTRLDSAATPPRYPVFLRRADNAFGPETGLIHDQAGFERAITDLRAGGTPLKGRIAVQYQAEQSPDGFFRKYGAFRIGDHIIPQHIQFDRQWIVKANSPDRKDAQITEELEFILDYPHETLVRDAFESANMQFGRADYGFVDGQFVLYEINSNPMFPRFVGGDPRRDVRRTPIRKAIVQALSEIDDGLRRHQSVPFIPPLSPKREFIELSNMSLLKRIPFELRLELRKRAAQRMKGSST